jgi:predicted secreted protein
VNKRIILLAVGVSIWAVACSSTSTSTTGTTAAGTGGGSTSTPAGAPSTTPGTSSGTISGTTSGSTPGSTANGQIPVYGKNDLNISTAVGQEFAIELESNASTGYTWTYTQTGSALKLVDETKSAGGTKPGAPGTQRFTFKATVSGASYLDFTYARSSPGPDDTKLRYDVTIA